MVFKYNFSVSGDNLYPEKIIDKIVGDFVTDSFFKPTDKRLYDLDGVYGYGGISFWHPKKFSTEDCIIVYETDFIFFIKNNYTLFVENGATEFQIFIEIYFDGGQCNFEIFNKQLLKQIGDLGVSLPISVYLLKNEEIQKWEDEIKLVWQSR